MQPEERYVQLEGVGRQPEVCREVTNCRWMPYEEGYNLKEYTNNLRERKQPACWTLPFVFMKEELWPFFFMSGIYVQYIPPSPLPNIDNNWLLPQPFIWRK